MDFLQRYALDFSRFLVAIIFLLNGLGIISQAGAAKELLEQGAPANLVPSLMLSGRSIEVVGRGSVRHLIVYAYGITASSSPVNSPYGGTLLKKSSMYSAPLMTVPGAPDGVIVTLIVAVCPGLRTNGENVAKAAGSVDASQKSPVGELTAGSNAFAFAVIEIVADPVGGAAAYGPHSVGSATQKGPAVTVPPDGL